MRSESFMNLRSFIGENIQHSKKVLDLLKRVDMIMTSSKGRDKIVGIFQYLAKMMALTTSNYTDDVSNLVKPSNKLIVHLVSKRTWKTLSQARKIFRFLKFIQAVEEIVVASDNLRNRKSFVNYLEVIAKSSSFFYFILDNIVWFINSNILNDILRKSTRKRVIYGKRLFSFVRVNLSIVINLCNIHSIRKTRDHVKYKLKTSYRLKESAREKLEIQLAKLNKDIKKEVLSISLYFMRFTMLYTSLKLFRHYEINKTFVAFLGCIGNFISVYRYIKKVENEEYTEHGLKRVFSLQNTRTRRK